jgi:hypothetical protein
MAKIEPTGDVLFHDNFEDLENWHAEGLVSGLSVTGDGGMRLDCTGSQQGGVGCMAFARPDFPDGIAIEYELFVEAKNGLIITFVAMKGLNGEDAITGVPARKGTFGDYIGTGKGVTPTTRSYHVSMSRYNDAGEHTGVTNWRRNPGLHLMGQGPDPCKRIRTPYAISICKDGPHLQLQVDGNVVTDFTDPGELPDEIPTAGKVGFRLIGARAIAQIRDFRVRKL